MAEDVVNLGEEQDPLVTALTILNDDIVGILKRLDSIDERIGAFEQRLACCEEPDTLESLRVRLNRVADRLAATPQSPGRQRSGGSASNVVSRHTTPPLSPAGSIPAAPIQTQPPMPGGG